MPSEDNRDGGHDDRCVLASIHYLGRNDFTEICNVSQHLIRARDGSREVFIWVIAADQPILAVPLSLIEQAANERARVDLICVVPSSGEHAVIRHLQNCIEAPHE